MTDTEALSSPPETRPVPKSDPKADRSKQRDTKKAARLEKKLNKKAGPVRRWRHRRHMHKMMTRELRRSAPGLIPRSLWFVGTVLAVVGIAAGIAAGGMVAWSDYRIEEANQEFDAELAELEKTLKPPPTAAGQNVQATVSEVTVQATDVTGDIRRGVGVVVASDESGAFILTSYDLVQTATLSPPAPVSVTSPEREWETSAWAWDPNSSLALLRVEGMTGVAARPWAASESITQGLSVAVPIPRLSPQEPLTVLQASIDALEGTQVRFRLASGAPTGGILINGEGQLVAVITAFLPDGTYIASVPTAACEDLLDCP